MGGWLTTGCYAQLHGHLHHPIHNAINEQAHNSTYS
jgi:hypothetical protein